MEVDLALHSQISVTEDLNNQIPTSVAVIWHSSDMKCGETQIEPLCGTETKQ